ncbi:transposase [Collimonas pratensis]|uniref:transposase n=1 Tax=Collimonas pratensis TaxID=279113 RepID=UPI003C710ACC
MGITGAPWRNLPELLVYWNHVYQRFAYWCDKGNFEAIFNTVQDPTLRKPR